jgi:hypothetical protein
MITNSRDELEHTFNICWGGVYNCPARFCRCCKMLKKVTSSIPAASTAFGRRSGHVSRTPRIRPRSSRSRASPALIADLRMNAPHIKCSVVMPGQIGTSIRANSRKIHSAIANRTRSMLPA